MSSKTYRTRKIFLIPFAIDMILLFVVIILSLAIGGTPQESIILIIVFIPLAYLFLESLVRKTVVAPQKIIIKKLFRKKELQWADITNVDIMVVRKKVYLLLTSTQGFHILSNAYADFTAMARDIADNAGTEKVEGRVREFLENPVRRIADIVSTWLAAVILVGIIYFKLIQNM